ncbi:MAG: translation initiation factor IF-2 [Oscillospiraceae bacterium]|nr:translation initiation factor IF-2 [Oscillospiraceae bacterium]
MPLVPKYKLSVVAKNFNLKNKDIQDILSSHSITGKSPAATLEDDELNMIFEHLTQNNHVENIDDYMYNPNPVVVNPVENAQKQEKTDDTTKKAETTEKPETPKIAENVSETAKTPEVSKTPVSKPVSQNNMPPVNRHENFKKDKPAYTANSQNRQNPQNTHPQNVKSGQQQNPNTVPQRTERTEKFNKQNRPEQILNRVQSNTVQLNKTEKTEIPAQNKFQQQTKRDFSNPAFNKNNNNRQDRFKNQQQNQKFNQNNQQNKDNKSKSTVDIISSSDNIKFAAGVKDESAKIVDTRTSTVDLSRYDENLETYVSDSDKISKDFAGEKQKLKKTVQNKERVYDRNGRPIDKERLALEKLQKKQQEQEQEKAKKKPLSIILPEKIIASDLASKLHITSAEVIKKLFLLGVKVSVNEEIEYDTAALLAMEFGAKVEKEVIVTIEDRLFDESIDTDDKLVARAPIVVVMGHVDHGKTTLLDAIKHTNVAAGEAGGITQHIGAYRVEVSGREITFLDTPGHAAFTAMRARGAQATDIAILAVSAAEGVMPQTVEAINHAKAANVAIIVAMTFIDKPQADPERLKQELTKYELVPEEWGGDIICVPVSAITGQGLDELLEMVLLTADMKELKANPDRLARGIIIEAKLDKGRGPIATVLIQNGTLKPGDIVIAGTTVGRVRAMNNDRGKSIKSAGPSVPVEVIGLSETPNAGDMFRVVEDEKMARELVERRKSDEKEEQFSISSNVTLEDLFAHVKSGIKELNLIIKADVQGSVEALKSALIKESIDEVKIKVIHSAVGGITESDVMLASASNAIVIGFNVRPDKTAIDAADRKGVDVRTYRIIYECIEEVNAAMKGMLAPKFKEVVLGHAQVRQTIKIPNVGTIAGSYVQDGKISRNAQIRIVRDGIVIFEDKIQSLKRFKDDAREVAQGYECGVGLERFNDIKELDILEAFTIEQIRS